MSLTRRYPARYCAYSALVATTCDLPDVGEQQVEEEAVGAAWGEDVDCLRGRIVAG